jgi:hypothetical protein
MDATQPVGAEGSVQAQEIEQRAARAWRQRSRELLFDAARGVSGAVGAGIAVEAIGGGPLGVVAAVVAALVAGKLAARDLHRE